MARGYLIVEDAARDHGVVLAVELPVVDEEATAGLRREPRPGDDHRVA